MSGKVKLKGILKTLVKELQADRSYKAMLKKFHQIAESKDRTREGFTMFLMFDIDDLEFKIQTEYNATHNQIALATAAIPGKGDKDKEIKYEEYRNKTL